MHYRDNLDSPQSCLMDIIGGGIDTVLSSDRSTNHELLPHLSSYPSMNFGEVSQPWKQGECYLPVIYGCPSNEVVGQATYVSKHSVPCNPEFLSRMSTWAVPNFWQDYNFPVLDILSRSPGPSRSSGLGDQYMRQYVSAVPMSLDNSSTNHSLDALREMKRPSGMVEPYFAPQLELKKSRSNPMHPILKVRKEKLGVRIAALQQLVAPYGKTDTASVLSEAICYIKLLQDQIEVLSSPYMKLSHSWTAEKSNEATIREENDGSIEGKATELKRRGICLVPLSCLSHIDFDNCGGPIFNWSIPRAS